MAVREANSRLAEEATGEITYYQTKDFQRALKTALMQGGKAQRKQARVREVLGSLDQTEPFKTLSVTNHGETRLRNCVKYDLGDGWRLVTRQTDRTCLFLFVGDHEDTERWLESHRGEDFGVKDGRLVRVPGVDPNALTTREHLADHHDTPLVDLLEGDNIDHLLDGLAPSLVRRLSSLSRGSTPEQIEVLLRLIGDQDKSDFVRNVLLLLHAGNVDGANAHIELRRGTIAPVEEMPGAELLDVADGDEVRRICVGSPEYERWLKDFEKSATWHDWFLFLHPTQQQVVDANYVGTAQLSGVSGSGKTCVVVRRALRLAGAPDARVLILTLNCSLSGLLQQLVDAACPDEDTRSRIQVASFFDLARSLLITFEPGSGRNYDDQTWKLSEHVDEIFREYYRQWANNNDARDLTALHRSLTARGVNAESYVREEFDWVRSAVGPEDRGAYLRMERKGRKFGILPEWRSDILKGLAGWERKMAAVGVVDYLGLTVALSHHENRIAPLYSHVLIDEAQDFGTRELRMVRRMVAPGPNDLFLCGDIAQTVLPKQRSLAEAGITIQNWERIQQNYRNSREILAAAYELLKCNLHEEMFESEDSNSDRGSPTSADQSLWLLQQTCWRKRSRLHARTQMAASRAARAPCASLSQAIPVVISPPSPLA